MKAKMLLILWAHLLLMWPPLVAQVTDDFSDGDFTQEPVWTGTDSVFCVNANYQLQLNATVGGNASLFIVDANSRCQPDSGDDKGREWRLWIREAFAPSSNNFTDIYLCENYFIRLGEAGSQDVIDLQRVDGTTTVSICRGSDNFIASPFSTFIKVTRSAAGLWQIFVDKTGNGEYILECQCVDKTYEPIGGFGIEITYSKSNAQRVYLDDVYIGPEIVDETPPELENINILNENQIALKFNEAIDETVALDADNYNIDNQLNSPDFVEFFENHSTILLTFSKTIQEDVNYKLIINKIQDVSGNVAENIEVVFIHHITHENDLLINEIMADPEPVVGLPAAEYIEVFNNSGYPIDIGGWFLTIGTTEKEITEHIVIQPDDYLIFCKNDAIEMMSDYGNCLGFSGFAVTNAGVRIELRNRDHELMSDVEFDLTWYRDKTKAEGGWSLEQIDPDAACAAKQNWRASTDKNGGTPGSRNSVDADNILIPSVDYIDVISENTIDVVFDQKMDIQTLGTRENYTIIEFDTHPNEITLFPEDTRRVRLHLGQDIEQNSVYNLLIENVLNCTGVPLPPESRLSFGLPVTPENGDIIINEILFNPIEPAGDYVELYNNSGKVFNLADMKIGVVKSTFPNPPDTTLMQICNENRLFLPYSFALLTTTVKEIAEQYECQTDNFLEMHSFPQYPNSEAVVILTHNSQAIDVIGYSEKEHYPLLTVTKGVSLERIGDGWHSAAAPLYGTPGSKNSSSVEDKEIDDEIEVIPKIFSPDNDGFDDITTINYKFNETGFTININIFDSEGRFMKRVADNCLAATVGYFVWDGLDANGHVVPPGIYVVLTEIFDLQGVVKRFKNAVVVVTR